MARGSRSETVVAERSPVPPTPGVPTLTLGEAIVGGAVLACGVYGWASLELAHAGIFRPWAAGIATLVVLAFGVAIARRAGAVRIAVDRNELAMIAVIGVVAGLLFFPGFPYGGGDKDPGVYVEHGILIARTGSYDTFDPVLARVPNVNLSSPGARLVGIWINDPAHDRVEAQFYHLFPALLATGYDLGGQTGLANVTPFFGLLAVLACALAARRAFGHLAGWLGGLLVATNMIEVWAAKYPASEIIAQAFLVAALLGIAVALKTGWRPAGTAAGVLTGLIFLARGDGLLIVLIAVGAGAVLYVVRRWSPITTWFAAGLAITMPSALAQAYHFALLYTRSQGLPSPGKLVAAVGTVAVAAVVLRRFPFWSRVPALAERRAPQILAGALLAFITFVLLVVGFLRRRLFGHDFGISNGVTIPTMDEINLRRLAFFVTLPGFALMWIGLAVTALRRWRAAAWALILPFLALFPLYAYSARVAPRLMWWTRRFVPFTLPGFLILVAVALVFLWRRRGFAGVATKLVAAGFAAYLLVVFAGQSIPLRSHHELQGSFAIVDRIAADAGPTPGVFLWPNIACCQETHYFSGPIWFQRGQFSALFTRPPTAAYVAEFVKAFPGHPVFVVTTGNEAPSYLPSHSFELADHIVASMPAWQETFDHRPTKASSIMFDFSLWRVLTTPV